MKSHGRWVIGAVFLATSCIVLTAGRANGEGLTEVNPPTDPPESSVVALAGPTDH